MKNKILVTGSVAYDRIMDFPGFFKNEILPEKLHILNVSFLVKELKESFGGTAGNIAYNLSLLGLKPSILAHVGVRDFILYEAWLRRNKIDFSQIKILPGQHTASAYIITDRADNQIAGFFPGAMSKPVSGKNFSVRDVMLAIVSAQHPLDMVALPKIFKQKTVPYIFDPGQQTSSLTGGQLKTAISGSKVLIGNDYEISLILKKTGWSLKNILKRTEMLVTTLGPAGSEIRRGNEVYKIKPAKPKNNLDPTGAGDAYRAGLIKGLIAGWDLKKTGQLAGLVAVYTVEQYGTQTHRFSLAELKQRYTLNFKDLL
ncbi:MAG: carbohydrate kinase family protein [Candidatus Buchananbacteria bacterium]|nr:carbohydrate kinase family protein [Candidatus Buchananbacteria bacterium]